MRMDKTLKVVVTILMGIVVILFLVYGSTMLGLSTTIRDDIVDCLPGLSVFFVGMGILSMIGISPFAIAGFGIVGVGISLLLGEMNTTGLLIDDLLGTITIAEAQGFVIVVSLMIGAVVSGISWLKK